MSNPTIMAMPTPNPTRCPTPMSASDSDVATVDAPPNSGNTVLTLPATTLRYDKNW